MAKLRVHELAKELGVKSSVVLDKLKEMGEFVKSASSTIEAPVVRRLREEFPAVPAGEPAEKPAPKKKAASSKAKAAPADEPAKDASAGENAAQPEPLAQAEEAPKKSVPKPGPRKAATPEPEPQVEADAPVEQAGGSTSDIPRPGGPRPGNNPFAPAQGMPRPGPRPGGPRPGNNPFAPAQGMPRPGGSRGSGADSAERGTQQAGRPGPRPGGPRPNPGMMPGHSSLSPRGGAGGGAQQRGGGRGRPGGAGRSGAPAGAGNGQGARPGGGAPGGFSGPRGRGGRGTTQGAFGRGGGRSKARKSKRAKRQEFEQMQAPSIGGVQVPRGDGKTALRLRRGSSLADFADKINTNPASLVTVLMHLGEMATATQSLDEATLEALGAELGYIIDVVSPEDEDRELLGDFNIDLDAEIAGEDDEDLVARPPVVTVMGHVDHGKTKLLDAIRSSNVVEGEAGGITQHIGAYQIHTEHDGQDRPITFIDTPGHEAFTAMRARGAQVTDIAILVVAADDGVMPQTVEALNHAQSAGVPIVVAVNKVDVEGANPAKVRQQLTEYNLVAEEYGGDTMFVDVSAKQRQGIDELLAAVLLTADASLDLRANPNKSARGVAIEANLDKGRGAVATVLVESGTLRIGDAIVTGTAYGRVRAMFEEHGESLTEAGPSRPVAVLGLTSVPRAGDSFLVTSDDRTARQIAERREAADRAATLARRRKRISLEDFTQALEEGKVETLNLVLKGDVSGAVEALEDAMLKLDVGDDVQLRVIHRGVGAITQNDVNLAGVDNAIIIGFNVRYAPRVEDLAEREGVDVRFYSVIYNAIEDIEAALKGMLKPEYEEISLGTAEIRQVFRSSKFGNIAGCLVTKGTIRRNSSARVLRDGVVVGEKLSIESLRREKDDATEVREGFECGIGLGSFNDIKVGDEIQTFEMQEKPRD